MKIINIIAILILLFAHSSSYSNTFLLNNLIYTGTSKTNFSDNLDKIIICKSGDNSSVSLYSLFDYNGNVILCSVYEILLVKNNWVVLESKNNNTISYFSYNMLNNIFQKLNICDLKNSISIESYSLLKDKDIFLYTIDTRSYIYDLNNNRIVPDLNYKNIMSDYENYSKFNIDEYSKINKDIIILYDENKNLCYKNIYTKEEKNSKIL